MQCGVNPRVELCIVVQSYLIVVVLVALGLLSSTTSLGYAIFGIALTILILIMPVFLLLRPKSTDDVYFVVWMYSRLRHFDHWDITASDDLRTLRIEMACRVDA